MNTVTQFARANALLLVVAVLMGGCAPAAAPTPTAPVVKINGNTCTYEGSTQLPPRVEVTWDTQDGAGDKSYQFYVITVDSSKTVEDVRQVPTLARTESEVLDWQTIVFWEELPSATKSTRGWNLKANSAYDGRPIYIVCGYDYNAIGVIGPIQVTD